MGYRIDKRICERYLDTVPTLVQSLQSNQGTAEVANMTEFEGQQMLKNFEAFPRYGWSHLRKALRVRATPAGCEFVVKPGAFVVGHRPPSTGVDWRTALETECRTGRSEFTKEIVLSKDELPDSNLAVDHFLTDLGYRAHSIVLEPIDEHQVRLRVLASLPGHDPFANIEKRFRTFDTILDEYSHDDPSE